MLLSDAAIYDKKHHQLVSHTYERCWNNVQFRSNGSSNVLRVCKLYSLLVACYTWINSCHIHIRLTNCWRRFCWQMSASKVHRPIIRNKNVYYFVMNQQYGQISYLICRWIWKLDWFNQLGFYTIWKEIKQYGTLWTQYNITPPAKNSSSSQPYRTVNGTKLPKLNSTLLCCTVLRNEWTYTFGTEEIQENLTQHFKYR